MRRSLRCPISRCGAFPAASISMMSPGRRRQNCAGACSGASASSPSPASARPRPTSAPSRTATCSIPAGRAFASSPRRASASTSASTMPAPATAVRPSTSASARRFDTCRASEHEASPKYGSECGGKIERQVVALEAIVGQELVLPLERRGGLPRHIDEPDLRPDAVDLVVDTRLEGFGPGIIRRLPLAVESRSQIKHEPRGPERHQLVRAEIDAEALPGRDVGVLDLLIELVGDRGDDGGGAVLDRIPGDRALELMAPEAEPDVVGGAGVVFADGCIESAADVEVPVLTVPAEPERLDEEVADAEAGIVDAAAETRLRSERRAQAGVAEGRDDVGAVVAAEDIPVGEPHEGRGEDEQVHVDLRGRRAAARQREALHAVAVAILEGVGGVEEIVFLEVEAGLGRHHVVADIGDRGAVVAEL